MNVDDINDRSGAVVDAAMKVHSALGPGLDAQLPSYLKLSDYRVGLLINFHELHLRDGIERIVDGL
jgi:hypothetical protein